MNGRRRRQFPGEGVGWFPSETPPADHEIEGAARRGRGRPRKWRPPGGPNTNTAGIDMHTVEAAHEAASAVIGGQIDSERLRDIARDLAGAWGSHIAFGGLFAMQAETGAGRPRSADALLVSDCREILAHHGLNATIGGDTDGAPRSTAVRLADALVRVMTEKNRPVSARQIRAARGISRGKRT